MVGRQKEIQRLGLGERDFPLGSERRSYKPDIPTRTAHIHRHLDGFLSSHTLQYTLRASLCHLDRLLTCLFATACDHLCCSKLAPHSKPFPFPPEPTNPPRSQT